MNELTRIVLEHTNPSLGPHEKKVTISLTISEQHEQRVAKFLEESQINNTMSLGTYLKAHRNKDETVLTNITEKSDIHLAAGSSISHLTFRFKDGKHVEFKDVYRRYYVSHFNPEFTEYMVEHGFKSVEDNSWPKF